MIRKYIYQIVDIFEEYKSKIVLNFKNTFFYMGGNLLQFLISIFTLPIYSRFLDPEQFAILGYYTAINAFFLPLFNLNLSTYYLSNYYSPKTTDKIGELSYAINILNISNIITGILGIFVVSLYFKIFEVQFPLYPYIFIVLLYLFLNKYRIFYLINCRIQKKGLYYFLVSAVIIIFNAIFSLFFVIQFNAGAAGKMAGPLFSQLLIASFILIIWLKSKHLRLSFYFKKDKLLDSFKFAWPLVLASYAYFPMANMDKIFLERLHNPNEFGFYNVGLMVSNYVGVFFLALYQSFEPDLYKFIHKKQKKIYLLSFTGYTGILIFVTLIFLIFSEHILSLLTSGRYTRASSYANIFIIGLAIQRMGGFFEPIFNAYKQTKYILITNIIVGIFSIFIYYVMIQWKQFSGANIARVLIGIFYLIISTTIFYFYFFKRKKRI